MVKGLSDAVGLQSTLVTKTPSIVNEYDTILHHNLICMKDSIIPCYYHHSPKTNCVCLWGSIPHSLSVWLSVLYTNSLTRKILIHVKTAYKTPDFYSHEIHLSERRQEVTDNNGKRTDLGHIHFAFCAL